MAQRIFKLVFCCLTALLLSFNVQASLFGNNTGGALNDRFLTADRAFVFNASQQGERVSLEWQISPGYYLYKHKIEIVPIKLTLGSYLLPAGTDHHDEVYGEVKIFRQKLLLDIPLKNIQDDAELKISYQGCAASGFCYPPETQLVKINPVDISQTVAAETPVVPAAVSSPTITDTTTATTASERREQRPELPFSPLWALLIGIGIAFTPCVLPMYPLISGIILGQRERPSQKRVLWLALVYVQGMAVTYTLLGLVVAAAGMKFQALLQHPYILIGLSIIFILLALSMFGLYTLQLPSSIQTKLVSWSNSQQGGSPLGVLVMGIIAGLICSPCTTAPLSAILLYIAQSGNLVVGSGTLYLYALGMGLPLILVTVFGSRLLPRSGPWMEYIKEAFGFVILALPVFLLGRILGDVWQLRLASMLALAFFIWAFVLSLRYSSGWLRLLQILLLAAALISVRPLQDWAFGTSTSINAPTTQFQPIDSIESLNLALQQATGKPVMLDFYADWCSSCKEFEKYTFSDPMVQAALANTVLLQADVTSANEQDLELMKKLQVLGLPTILFFDASGQELPALRVSGFMSASDFQQHLQQVTAAGETN